MMHSWESASCGSVVHLNKGDQVYIQSDWYKGKIKSGHGGDNKFTGFMLNPTTPQKMSNSDAILNGFA